MKKIIILSVTGILCYTGAIAQKASTGPQGRGLVSGMVSGERAYMPLEGVQAFLYAANSSIAGSGYTDGTGKYETNKVPNGTYEVKFVYPNTKSLTVTGVTIKANQTTVLSIKQPPPAADTTASFNDVMPQAAPAGKHKKK